MKIIHRIFKYLEYKKIAPTRAEREVGVSNGYLGVQLKKEGDIGEGQLCKFIEYYRDINPLWLLTGEGSMIKEDNICGNQVPEAIVEYTQERKSENWLHEKIDNLMEDNSRNSRSIEKMVDTADRNSRMLEKMINMLDEKGINMADSIEIQKGASHSNVKGKTKLTDKTIISK